MDMGGYGPYGRFRDNAAAAPRRGHRSVVARSEGDDPTVSACRFPTLGGRKRVGRRSWAERAAALALLDVDQLAAADGDAILGRSADSLGTAYANVPERNPAPADSPKPRRQPTALFHLPRVP